MADQAGGAQPTVGVGTERSSAEDGGSDVDVEPEDAGRRRLVTWDDPSAGAALSTQLSGLEYLQRIIDGRVPGPPVALLLGMHIVEIGPGEATFSLEVGEHLYNPLGSVHGGIFCTLLDSSMSCAVHTTLPAGKAYTTLELKVNLVKPLTMSTAKVRSVGKVLSAGRRVATASGQIIGPDGALYAHGTATCLVFDAPPAKDDGQRPAQ